MSQTAVRVAIVDHGIGNRRSVEKALEHVGAEVVVTAAPEQLAGADGLYLPGVGAFPAAMRALRALSLVEVLRQLASAGKPILGACLGMQLLFERSDEQGGAEGLGLLPGHVRELRAGDLKLPHIGWCEVFWSGRAHDAAGAYATPTDAPAGWPLSAGLPARTFLYHVHSYVAEVGDPQIVLAEAEHGEVFPTVVGSGRIFGTQSHPEKSSAQGLRLLESFLAICAAAARQPEATDSAKLSRR
ncbi:MAG TPA: imidazole glycerol phosphate synthase subunit HisH [Solirubrobacteraceae bacterium]|nr:imidazole glycerol phosphate synthase subunit HisH [Solirubrobacteraceae bacterium]